MALKYVQTLTQYQAGAGSIIGATSIVLTAFTDVYGNVLTMADFGAKGYGTCESDTSNEEPFTFTGVTANANGTYTLTGVSTVLAKSPYTETSGLTRQHSGGTKVVITDNAAFWNTFGNKLNDETLTGRWGTGVAPTNGNDLVNKTYADGLAIAGAPDSSTTVKGIGKVSVAPVSPTSPIFVGDNDNRVSPVSLASLTANKVAALAGTGTPSSSDPYLNQSTLTGIVSPYAGFSAPSGWLLCDGSAVSRATYANLFSVVVSSLGTITVTIAAPGLVTLTAHGLSTGDAIYFTTTGALPTGLTVNTQYWVIKNDANSFWLATSLANALVPTKITTSGTQSGVHTMFRCPFGVGDGSTTFNLPDLRGNIPVGLKTSDASFAGVAQTGGEKTHVLTTTEMPSHTHGYLTSSVSSGGPTNYGSSSTFTQTSQTTSAGSDGAHNNLQPYITLNYIIKV